MNCEIRELSTAEFGKLFDEYAPKIFDANELILRPYTVISEDEKKKIEELRKPFDATFRLNLGMYVDGEFAGWSWGFQDSGDSYYMVNSAVLEKFRKRGLYTRLLDDVMKRLADKGFQRIYSRHSMTNNAILIPKLKKGFVLTAFEMTDIFGLVVHLTYFTNATRRRALDFRVGNLRPDDELKRLFKL
jgi:ribosomal protein S18 acetylase RimI-like enzyme